MCQWDLGSRKIESEGPIDYVTQCSFQNAGYGLIGDTEEICRHNFMNTDLYAFDYIHSSLDVVVFKEFEPQGKFEYCHNLSHVGEYGKE